MPLLSKFHRSGNDRPTYPEGPLETWYCKEDGTWAIELSKFDMHYELREPIKGQVYTCFMTELSPKGSELEPDNFLWILSVDGSSNQQGSVADIILEWPNGVLIEQSLRFAFKASNNQAEYKAQ